MVESESPEQKILAAARSEFIEFGFHGARTQAIADRCGVNKALLHYYFRSKERLYEAVLQDIAQTMRAAMEVQLEEGDPGEDIRSLLRRIIATYIGTLQHNPDIARFMFREIAEGGGHLPGLIAQVAPSVSGIPEHIGRRLAAEVGAGKIREVAGIHLLLNIVGMCVFTFVARPIVAEVSRQFDMRITFDDSFYRDRIESIVDLVMQGITTDPNRKKGKK